MELATLVVPQASAAEEAGKLIKDLPRLWEKATIEERRNLLLSVLDAVYVDAKDKKRVIAIRPKPPFRPIFQVAVTQEGSGITLWTEPLGKAPSGIVFLVEAGEDSSPTTPNCSGSHKMRPVASPL